MVIKDSGDRRFALFARQNPISEFYHLPRFLWENAPQEIIFDLEKDYSNKDLYRVLGEHLGRSVDYKGYWSCAPRFFEQTEGVLIRNNSYVIITLLRRIIINLNDLLIEKVNHHSEGDLYKIVLKIDQDDFSTRRVASCR